MAFGWLCRYERKYKLTMRRRIMHLCGSGARRMFMYFGCPYGRCIAFAWRMFLYFDFPYGRCIAFVCL